MQNGAIYFNSLEYEPFKHVFSLLFEGEKGFLVSQKPYTVMICEEIQGNNICNSTYWLLVFSCHRETKRSVKGIVVVVVVVVYAFGLGCGVFERNDIWLTLSYVRKEFIIDPLTWPWRLDGSVVQPSSYPFTWSPLHCRYEMYWFPVYLIGTYRQRSEHLLNKWIIENISPFCVST